MFKENIKKILLSEYEKIKDKEPQRIKNVFEREIKNLYGGIDYEEVCFVDIEKQLENGENYIEIIDAITCSCISNTTFHLSSDEIEGIEDAVNKAFNNCCSVEDYISTNKGLRIYLRMEKFAHLNCELVYDIKNKEATVSITDKENISTGFLSAINILPDEARHIKAVLVFHCDVETSIDIAVNLANAYFENTPVKYRNAIFDFYKFKMISKPWQKLNCSEISVLWINCVDDSKVKSEFNCDVKPIKCMGQSRVAVDSSIKPYINKNDTYLSKIKSKAAFISNL